MSEARGRRRGGARRPAAMRGRGGGARKGRGAQQHMEVIETKAEGLKRAYEATASADEIAARVDAKIEELRPTAQLKGFRKGKAPKDLLRKLFGKSMMGDVMQQIVDDTLKEHLEKHAHRPTAAPEVRVVNENFGDGDDLKVEFSYELMPDVPEVAFKEIKLERLTVSVADEAVDEALENLAANAKSFETKDGAAENGDQVVIDFVGKVDGEAFEGGSADDFPLELGGGRFIPGFEDQLVGVAAGDAREVAVTFPEDYGAEALAGKPAVFDVTVKEVKAAASAPIDDALAARYGAENLEDLKVKLRERLAGEYRGAARALLKRRLLDALAEKVDFEAPESMWMGEARQIAYQLWREKNQDAEGEAPADLEPDEEHVALAKRRVRLGLLHSDVGQTNRVAVTETELANAVAEQASRYPGQERQFYEYVMKDPQMKSQVSAPIFEDKVVDFIFELADISEREVDAEALKAELEKLDDES